MTRCINCGCVWKSDYDNPDLLHKKCPRCGSRTQTQDTYNGNDIPSYDTLAHKNHNYKYHKDKIPPILAVRKKCLNCGYERQEKDDLYGIIPPSDCPKCGAIYEKVEKFQENKRERELERELKIQRIRRERAQEEREEIARRCRQFKVAEIKEQFKPKAKIPFLLKIAVKTAVKKNLLDITDRLDLLHCQNQPSVICSGTSRNVHINSRAIERICVL